jgi:FtsP/CotA-like multicopper oxidase with cupredoxin domain
MIRVREGRVVHSNVRTRTGPHTIHHHGIEPTPMNDGVGHLTFEVASGRYTYQWVAAEAGTYFYHCHRNTTLHFERGMYGPLIIDPDVPGAPFTTWGSGQTYVANDLVGYAAEALWVVDDIDTRWHGLGGINYGPGRNPIDNVAAGLQAPGAGKFGDTNNAFTRINDPDNPRLHDFDPNVFAVSGFAVPVNPTPRAVLPGQVAIPRSIDNHRLVQVGVGVQAGGKVLVRALNAAYCHTHWVFPAAIPGLVTAADGRTFGREPWGERYSAPVPLSSINHRFQLSVARRWDVLLDTAGVAPGIYDVAVSVHTSIGDDRLVTIRLPITVL